MKEVERVPGERVVRVRTPLKLSVSRKSDEVAFEPSSQ